MEYVIIPWFMEGDGKTEKINCVSKLETRSLCQSLKTDFFPMMTIQIFFASLS